MSKKSISVKLIGKQNGYYKIAFPNLKIPVGVDKNLYQKMKDSMEYEFIGDENNGKVSRVEKEKY